MEHEIDAGSPQEAVAVLRAGGIVLVPTETVVGLVAADARRLNEAKGSDPSKPLTLLCASAEEAFALTPRVPPLARMLAERLWPGPLTLVLDRQGGGTVGVRVPGGTVTEVLAAFGEPVYATSANLSGEPAPKSLEDVDPRIAEDVDLVIQGEPGNGEPSAVVDLSGDRARMLRSTAKFTDRDLERLTRRDRGDADAR